MDSNNGKKPFFTMPRILFFIIIVLLLLNVILNISLLRSNSQNSALRKDLALGQEQTTFRLLSPTVAWLSVDDFLLEQKSLIISFADLKPTINSILNDSQTHGKFGVYLEDLTTGAWLGINEKDTFVPASLLKIPVMIAVLKRVEAGNLSLDQIVAINKDDIDLESGSLGYNGPGYKITIRELLKKMIQESDNTAFFTFTRRILTMDELEDTTYAIGLHFLTESNSHQASPKEYANMLRGLYYSSYLRRQFSELALSIMLETDFNSQIPSGLPTYVQVSHKVGMYMDGGYYHDCGIVYLPSKPYILCVMSINSTQEESNKIISAISKNVYDYMVEKLRDGN
jgi:beta-lactamase class A